jgi:hypothetical protein
MGTSCAGWSGPERLLRGLRRLGSNRIICLKTMIESTKVSRALVRKRSSGPGMQVRRDRWCSAKARPLRRQASRSIGTARGAVPGNRLSRCFAMKDLWWGGMTVTWIWAIVLMIVFWSCRKLFDREQLMSSPPSLSIHSIQNTRGLDDAENRQQSQVLHEAVRGIDPSPPSRHHAATR